MDPGLETIIINVDCTDTGQVLSACEHCVLDPVANGTEGLKETSASLSRRTHAQICIFTKCTSQLTAQMSISQEESCYISALN